MMIDILNQVLQSLRSIPTDVKTIIERKIQLVILEFGDSISKSVAVAIPKLKGAVLLVLGAMFLLTGLSIFIGDVLQKPYLGFVIVGAIFTLAGLVFVKRRVDITKDETKLQIEQQFIEIADKVDSKKQKQDSLTTK
ncbi:hypothetical protein EP331_07080 [bacterium]|nr:MAG: hypothetical protein EP331_07080 [bacterium]